MDLRKILAAALSLTMMCSAATTLSYAPLSAYAADPAAEEPAETTEDETVTYPIEAEADGCKYTVYKDYAVFAECADKYKGDLVIPAEVNGVPVKKIAERAFGFQKELISVTFPATVTEISDHLAGYSTVEKYIVDKNSATFCSVDGVVFTKDMKKLVAYPASAAEKAYTVPSGVEVIGRGAAYTADIESLTLSDSVTKIDDFAFTYCKKLKSINFSKNLKSIGYSSFSNCAALESAVIPASVEELGTSSFSECKAMKTLTINNPNCKIASFKPNNDVVIRGYEGSTAQAYAEKNNFTFEVLGSEPPIAVTTTAASTTAAATTTTSAAQSAETLNLKYATYYPIQKIIGGKPYNITISGLYSVSGEKVLDETADIGKVADIKSGVIASVTRAAQDVDFTASEPTQAAAIPFIQEKAISWYNDNYAALTGYKLTALSIKNFTVNEQAASVVTSTTTAPETTAATTTTTTASSSETTTVTTTSPDPYNPLYIGSWHLKATGTLPYDLASMDATVSGGGSGSVSLVYTDGAHAIYNMTWTSDGDGVTATVDGRAYSAQYDSATDSAAVNVGGADLVFVRGTSAQTTTSAETSATTSQSAETATETTTTTASETTTTAASTTAPETTSTTPASISDEIVGKWKFLSFTDADGNPSDKSSSIFSEIIFNADGTGKYTEEGAEVTSENGIAFTWTAEEDTVTVILDDAEADVNMIFFTYKDSALTFDMGDGAIHFTKEGSSASKLGDVNGDGSVNAKDASAILVEYALLSTGESPTFSAAQKQAADVNADGKTDAKDASSILSYYAYLSTGGTKSLEEYLAK